MRRSHLPILILVWALQSGAALAQTGHATPVADLTQQWVGYWNAKNLAQIMTLYAPDPVFLTTSGERWTGVPTIRKNFAKGLKQFDPRLTVTTVRSAESGNLAYDSGTFDEVAAPTKGGKAIRAKGNYLFVFQRKSRRSGWKILEQIWTEFDSKKL